MLCKGNGRQGSLCRSDDIIRADLGSKRSSPTGFVLYNKSIFNDCDSVNVMSSIWLAPLTLLITTLWQINFILRNKTCISTPSLLDVLIRAAALWLFDLLDLSLKVMESCVSNRCC